VYGSFFQSSLPQIFVDYCQNQKRREISICVQILDHDVVSHPGNACLYRNRILGFWLAPAPSEQTHTRTHTHTHTNAYIYTRTHTEASTHSHKYIHIHTHAHTRTHANTHTRRQMYMKNDSGECCNYSSMTIYRFVLHHELQFVRVCFVALTTSQCCKFFGGEYIPPFFSFSNIFMFYF